MTLECHQCSSTDLEKTSPREYRCRHCGAITIVTVPEDVVDAYEIKQAKQRTLRTRIALLAIAGGVIVFAILTAYGAVFTLARSHTLASGELKRFGSPRSGHGRMIPSMTGAIFDDHSMIARPNVVRAMALSRDGKSLATMAEKDIIVWNVADGSVIAHADRSTLQAEGYFRDICWIEFFPDGKRIACAPDYGRVLILDAKTLNPIHRISLPHESEFRAGRIVHDGTVLALTETRIDVDRYVVLHAIRDAVVSTRIKTKSDIDSVFSGAISPNGSMIAFPQHKSLAVCDTETGRVITAFEAAPAALGSIAFGPDGARLAYQVLLRDKSSIGESVLFVRDIESGDIVARIRHDSEASGWSIAFSPDGRLICPMPEAKRMRIYTTADGAPLRTLSPIGTSYAIHFTHDGKSVITGGEDMLVRFWRVPER